MKKGIRIVGIAIICIGIIVGYYYYLSNHGKKDVENSTEISKVDEALSRGMTALRRQSMSWYKRFIHFLMKKRNIFFFSQKFS